MFLIGMAMARRPWHKKSSSFPISAKPRRSDPEMAHRQRPASPFAYC